MYTQKNLKTMSLLDVLRKLDLTERRCVQQAISAESWLLSRKLRSGNYKVQFTITDICDYAAVWASPRRLVYLQKNRSKQGDFFVDFTVNVNKKLLLEFSGNFKFTTPKIKRDRKAITVYLAGDSTVCDQEEKPWCTWGQMLPLFFVKGVTIANQAHSGMASRSFITKGRLRKVLKQGRPGDYLFIHFAHNDQKTDSTSYAEPFKTYQSNLQIYIERARMRGMNPILMTPVERATFDSAGEFQNSHGDYPDAVRFLAQKENVPLLDLSLRSEKILRHLGPEGCRLLTVNALPGRWPKYPDGIKSKSHHTEYGAFEMARCVAAEIQETIPELSIFLRSQTEFQNINPELVGPWEVKFP